MKNNKAIFMCLGILAATPLCGVTRQDKASSLSNKAKDNAKNVYDTAKSKARAIKNDANDLKDTAKDKAKDVYDTAKSKARAIKDQAQDKVEKAKDKVQDVYDAAKEKAQDIKAAVVK